MIDRLPTGIDGLDPLIGGGFPRGSLILLDGEPGTGKTIFASRFLCHGATEHDENGIYVSFLEGKKTLIENLSGFCDQDYAKLDKEGKFRILDLVTTKEEGISVSLESILDEVHTLKAKRLVIDSFSAMAQAFKEPIDSRIVLHTILSRMVRHAGCTTLLIVENPIGAKGLGLGIEEFVADGVITLRRRKIDGRLARRIEITKLRGTRIESPSHPFTLEGGPHVIPPFSHESLGQLNQLEHIPDYEGHFSTGNKSLDRILGGYPKGSLVLLEVGEAVPLTAYGILTYPIVANFLNNKAPVIGIQSLGADPARTFERWKGVAGENAAYGRSIERQRASTEERPYLVSLKSERPEERVAEYLQVGTALRKQTGKPALWWVSLDHFVDIFDVEHAEKTLSELSMNVIRNRELAVILRKPGLDSIARTASNIAAIHIRVFDRDGSILLYGAKPRTSLYALTMDPGKGLNSVRFMPMV
jgi:KaiC/GvpD/RAD55 family RecA-like ATPase